MRTWLILLTLLLGACVLAACGDAPPTPTPQPSPTPVPPTLTPVPTATPIPPLTFKCGADEVTAALADSGAGTEGAHAVDLVRRIGLDPRFSAPSGPWRVVRLSASGLAWTNVFLVSAGDRLFWFVKGTDVTPMTAQAQGLSVGGAQRAFPDCGPPLDAVADYRFNAVSLP
jgi:hypothetical protein